MNYPEQLLPKLIFKEIKSDLSAYFLCRKVEDKSLLENQSSIASEELLGIERVNDCFDYSTNLPGIFELQHNEIELFGDKKKLFRSYWDWASEVETPIYKQDFELNIDAGWFFLPIDKIVSITIPFNKNAQKNDTDIARAVAVHTPTNCNFWHFSIKWKDSAGFINSNDSAWKRKIIATVRSLFSELIVFEVKEQKVEKSFYS